MQAVDMKKQREIHFQPLPTDQAAQAARLLSRLPEVVATPQAANHGLQVSYSLPTWTLQQLEERLLQAGFHLDGALLHRIRRALVHYTESVQLENLHHPEREYKTKEVYTQAWEHHPHGDHDDTPEDLREYR